MTTIIDLHFLGLRKAIAAFLHKMPNGQLVLIETGPFATLNRLESQIKQAGYQIEDIKQVFLTHIHLDHAGAAWYFAQQGATIYVHPAGFAHLQDPSKLMNSARRIYKEHTDALWGSVEPIASERLQIVQHGQKIAFDDTQIVAWHTPGHAVHHIAWQIGDALFAGDVAGVRINGGIPVPPCPPPDIQVQDWLESIELIQGLSLKTLYLTHFGAIDDVNFHLNELRDNLLKWATWMKPYAEQNADMQTITPLFADFVREYLSQKGVQGDDIDRYEAANPAWMSVAGLMRYWKTKAV